MLCKFADGGQKKRQNQGKYHQNGRQCWERARLWESCFFLLFSWWFQSQVLIQLSLSRSYTHTGRDDANIWPYSCFTKMVGSEIITQEMLYFVLLIMTLHGNSSFFKKCVCRPLQVYSPSYSIAPNRILLRLLSLPTCTQPYPTYQVRRSHLFLQEPYYCSIYQVFWRCTVFIYEEFKFLFMEKSSHSF